MMDKCLGLEPVGGEEVAPATAEGAAAEGVAKGVVAAEGAVTAERVVAKAAAKVVAEGVAKGAAEKGVTEGVPGPKGVTKGVAKGVAAAGRVEAAEGVPVVEIKSPSDSYSDGATHDVSCSDLSPDSTTSSSSSTAHSLPSTSIAASFSTSNSTSISITTAISIAIKASLSSSRSTLFKIKPVKVDKKPSNSGPKNYSSLSKSEGKIMKVAMKEEKKLMQKEMKENIKKSKTEIVKRRVGRPCKVKSDVNIGCSAAIIDLRDRENAPSAPEPSSLLLPSQSLSLLPERLSVQSRIMKRKRDSWLSDSDCSTESECNVL